METARVAAFVCLAGACGGSNATEPGSGAGGAVQAASSSSSSASATGGAANPALCEKSFDAPVAIEQGDEPVGAPALGHDASGRALVAFTQGGSAYLAGFDPAQDWLAPVLIEDVAGQIDQLAFDVAANGDALAVWLQVNGLQHEVWAAHRAAGRDWEAPVQLSAAGQTSDVQVVMQGSGHGIAAWHTSSPQITSVYVSRYVPGAGWDEPVAFASDGHKRVGMDDEGNAFAVWRSDGFERDLFASRAPMGGAWTSPAVIESTDEWPRDPRLAVDRAGNAVVLWQQGGAASGGPGELWANRYDGDGWGTPLRLAPADGGPLVLGGELAFDESGRAFVAYVEHAGNQVGLWSRRWNEGWSEPEAVIDGDDPIQAHMTIATRGGEALLLFARQLDGAEPRVEQVCYTAATGWSAPVPMNDPLGVPLLDMEDSGNALAVWGKLNQSGWMDLMASRYR